MFLGRVAQLGIVRPLHTLCRLGYSYLELVDDLARPAPTRELDVTFDSAVSILTELSGRPPVTSFGEDYNGDRAWISFLDAPYAFHLYLESGPGRVRYELFRGEDISGVASFAAAMEALRIYFSRQSPAEYLQTHSLEIYEDEA